MLFKKPLLPTVSCKNLIIAVMAILILLQVFIATRFNDTRVSELLWRHANGIFTESDQR
jgi:hypothetical protein